MHRASELTELRSLNTYGAVATERYYEKWQHSETQAKALGELTSANADSCKRDDT